MAQGRGKDAGPMDNDETHYPNASAEAIRAYYDVRDWEACPMSGPGPIETCGQTLGCPLIKGRPDIQPTGRNFGV